MKPEDVEDAGMGATTGTNPEQPVGETAIVQGDGPTVMPANLKVGPPKGKKKSKATTKAVADGASPVEGGDKAKDGDIATDDHDRSSADTSQPKPRPAPRRFTRKEPSTDTQEVQTSVT